MESFGARGPAGEDLTSLREMTSLSQLLPNLESKGGHATALSRNLDQQLWFAESKSVLDALPQLHALLEAGQLQVCGVPG